MNNLILFFKNKLLQKCKAFSHSGHWSPVTGHSRAARAQRGNAMIELLLSLAIFAVLLPFVIRWEKARVVRAENIVIARDIDVVRTALERYISENKKDFLGTVSRNITRVRIADLKDYGVTPELIAKYGNDFQLRILKSADVADHAVLQGIVIMNSADFTPLRTREITLLGGADAGFIEGAKAYGAYGTWGQSVGQIGGAARANALTANTRALRSGDDYIWRLPSDDAADATLASDMNLGGHDIANAGYADARAARFEQSLSANEIAAGKIIWSNRAELSGNLQITGEATVNGILSADARGMQINGDIFLDNSARFNTLTAKEIWANTMTLSGLTAAASGTTPAIMKVSGAVNMTGGRIDTMYATVGFAGSLTPRLAVQSRIIDSTDPSYFWNLTDGTANFADLSLPTLNQMMRSAVSGEGTDTDSYAIMSTVAANANATVSDFMMALSAIQTRVRAKYKALNLE